MTILVQQQLRELAQAAPHKDWRAGNYYGKPFIANIEVLADTPEGLMVVMQGNQNFIAESVAVVAFVGAASPAAILALLDELDQLKLENADLKDGLNRIIRETRLSDVAFGITCEVMGELGVEQDPEEQRP